MAGFLTLMRSKTNWCCVIKLRMPIAFLGASLLYFSAPSVIADSKAPKTTVPLSIVFLGTSLTANYTWPNEIGAKLSHCLDQKVVVENLAVAGANSEDGLEQLRQMHSNNPKLVLVEFSVNDADIWDGLSLHASRVHHEALIEAVRLNSAKTEIVLLTMNPVHGMRGLMRPYLLEYYRLYKDLAAAKGVAFADLHVAWDQVLSPSTVSAMLPDGLHPSASASSQVAKSALFPAILQVLGAPRTERC